MTAVEFFYGIIQSDGLRYFYNDLLRVFQKLEKTLKKKFLKTDSFAIL